MEKTMMKNQKGHVKPVLIIIYAFLVILAVIYIAPLLWMLSVSLKDNAEVMASPFSFPKAMQFVNYAEAWTLGKLGIALLNSLLVCGVTLVVSLFFGAMAAFAIARMKWKLSEGMHTFFLIGMMVPVHCILIPLFVRFAKSWAYQLTVWTDAAVYHLLAADDHLPSDRIFQVYAGRTL